MTAHPDITFFEVAADGPKKVMEGLPTTRDLGGFALPSPHFSGAIGSEPNGVELFIREKTHTLVIPTSGSATGRTTGNVPLCLGLIRGLLARRDLIVKFFEGKGESALFDRPTRD